jgi:hypothetical protein
MYFDVLYRVRDAVRRKPPEKWRTKSWFLFHDNAPAHRSVLVKHFLTKNNPTTHNIPHTLPTWLHVILLVCFTEICIEGTAFL